MLWPREHHDEQKNDIILPLNNFIMIFVFQTIKGKQDIHPLNYYLARQ